MDAITLLHERVSCPALTGPAPTAEQLDVMYQAALRAPDHGALRPWRFLTIQGDGLKALGELYLEAGLAKDPDLSEAHKEKLKSMPLRAPMIIVVIGVTQAHPKVPEIEQVVAAGCAAQNIILAAHALGLGAMWRTGDMAYDKSVREGLGIKDNEEIIGYIYLGQPSKTRKVPVHTLSDYVMDWTGE